MNGGVRRNPSCASHLFLFSPAGGLGRVLQSCVGGGACPRTRPHPKYVPKTLGQTVGRMVPSCAMRGWLRSRHGLPPTQPGPLGLMDKASDF